jgi:hypothetical protein
VDFQDTPLVQPPVLPDLQTSLRTPEDFFLTFGGDAILAYYPRLRWLIFLTEPEWQQSLLNACACLGDLFGATDCVLMNDFHPAVYYFLRGHDFASALASAGPEEGEVPDLRDLYIDRGTGAGWDSKSYWRFRWR